MIKKNFHSRLIFPKINVLFLLLFSLYHHASLLIFSYSFTSSPIILSHFYYRINVDYSHSNHFIKYNTIVPYLNLKTSSIKFITTIYYKLKRLIKKSLSTTFFMNIALKLLIRHF